MSVEFGSEPSLPDAKVPALVLEVNEQSIRDYLALSDQLPLLVLFAHSDDENSKLLKQKLATLTEAQSGKLILLVVDAIKSPQLAKAFEVSQLPSVFGLLKGQPAPLFVGDQPVEQLQMVIRRVMEVAQENGLVGAVEVSAESDEPLSASQLAAFEAIDSGDYEAALAIYEKALAENPNDQSADSGKAQVQLLIRLRGQDLDKLAQGGTSIAEKLLAADALVATGQPQLAFSHLLDLFESSDKEVREQIRLRLVELFKVVGQEDENVSAARRRLSLLLF